MSNLNRRIMKIALFPLLLAAIGLFHSYLLLKLPFLASLGAFALPATSAMAGLLVAGVFSYPLHAIYKNNSLAVAVALSLLVATWRVLIMGKISSDSVVIATWAADIICLGLFPLGVLAIRRMRRPPGFE